MAELTNHISQIKFSPTSDAYIIDAKYINGELVSDVLDELRSAVSSAMVFKGTVGTTGTVTALPTAASDKIGDTYKVVSNGTYAGMTAELGDIFICADVDGTAKWVHVPSGDEKDGTVTQITKEGKAIKFTVNGLDSNTITETGSIKWVPDTHWHTYSASGEHDHVFEGTNATIETLYTPNGSVKLSTATAAGDGIVDITPSGTVSIEHAANGSVESTFAGDAATIDISVPDISKLSLDNHKIDIPTEANAAFTGTPAELTYETVTSIDAANAHTISTIDSISAKFTGTPGAVDYDKATSVSMDNHTISTIDSITATFNGTNGAVNVSGSLDGLTDEKVVTSVGSESINVITGIETTPTAVIDSVSLTDELDGETLIIGISVTNNTEVIGSVTPNGGSAVKSINPTSKTVGVTVEGSLGGNFTPVGTVDVTPVRTDKKLSHNNISIGYTTTESADFTPVGTVDVTPVRTDKTLSHNKQNINKGTSTIDYTPAGGVDVTLVTSEKTLTHTGAKVTGTTISSTSYTPSGNITSVWTPIKDTLTGTFTGSAKYIKATFTGTEATISTTYTPQGTVKPKTLTLSGNTTVGTETETN